MHQNHGRALSSREVLAFGLDLLLLFRFLRRKGRYSVFHVILKERGFRECYCKVSHVFELILPEILA